MAEYRVRIDGFSRKEIGPPSVTFDAGYGDGWQERFIRAVAANDARVTWMHVPANGGNHPTAHWTSDAGTHVQMRGGCVLYEHSTAFRARLHDVRADYGDMPPSPLVYMGMAAGLA